MPEEGGLKGLVLEPVAERIDALGAVDRGPEGQEVVLPQGVERDAEPLPEKPQQMTLVPELERQPGPQRFAQRALDGRPVAQRALVGHDHEARRAVGGRAGLPVLAPHAVEEAGPRVAGVDLDEVRWRPARAHLDVGEGSQTDGHLLPDPTSSGGTPSWRCTNRR